MYIIVVGGGKVGYYLTKTLITEGHEVLVIEQNAKKAEQIADELGSVAMRGDGCEAATLEEGGTARADMLIAVTGDDEDNLVSCQVAKHKFHVPRTIARLNNPKNEEIFKKLGIDLTVSSTNLILEQIEEEVPTHPLIHLLSLKSQGMEIVEIKLSPDSKIIGKALKDIPLPPESVIPLVICEDKGAHIPSEDTVLEADDKIVAVTRPESEGALRAAFAGS